MGDEGPFGGENPAGPSEIEDAPEQEMKMWNCLEKFAIRSLVISVFSELCGEGHNIAYIKYGCVLEFKGRGRIKKQWNLE